MRMAGVGQARCSHSHSRQYKAATTKAWATDNGVHHRSGRWSRARQKAAGIGGAKGGPAEPLLFREVGRPGSPRRRAPVVRLAPAFFFCAAEAASGVAQGSVLVAWEGNGGKGGAGVGGGVGEGARGLVHRRL